jgi:tetraprenyl-beta-curcumene synthase
MPTRADTRATFAFARAARAYLLAVFPLVRHELAAWRARAERIPDPRLRGRALQALAERGNMEGAAAFATFAARRHRPAVVAATVAFQAAYNHLDLLSELVGTGEADRARLMHLALPAALAGSELLADFPAPSVRPAPARRIADHRSPPVWAAAAGADGGYLQALVARCRDSFATLPSAAIARPSAIAAAERVVAFQSWQAGGPEPDAAVLGLPAAAVALGAPAAEPREPAAHLRSFELAGAAGSSLGVHALIAAAADSALTPPAARALDAAYFPAIGALHTLLDHLIDRDEDCVHGQRNLTDHYPSPLRLEQRLAGLTRTALAAARTLPDRPRHELIVCAMACFYLSSPAARTQHAQPAARAVAAELGRPAALARGVFAARAWLQPAKAATESSTPIDASHGCPHVLTLDPRNTRFPGDSWARRVSNLRPLACEASALPLSYAPWELDSIGRQTMVRDSAAKGGVSVLQSPVLGAVPSAPPGSSRRWPAR